jgi:long-subunit fatty acid transport protein
MPAVWAVGASWQAQPSLLFAADLKSIGWSDSMKSFKMRYDSAVIGGSVSFSMPQNWKDQTVLSLGMAWKASGFLNRDRVRFAPLCSYVLSCGYILYQHAAMDGAAH